VERERVREPVGHEQRQVAVRVVDGRPDRVLVVRKRARSCSQQCVSALTPTSQFQNGWDVPTLQNALDKCNSPNDQTGSGVTAACSYLTLVDASVATACKIKPIVNVRRVRENGFDTYMSAQEVVAGNLTKLPGCNPLQAGPGNATMYTDATCPH
jgi:hypothetical protein